MRARCNITVELGPGVRLLTPGSGSANLTEQIRAPVQDWLNLLNLPVDCEVALVQNAQPAGPRFIDAAVILNGLRCGFSKKQLARAYDSSISGEVADLTAGVTAARFLLSRADFNEDRDSAAAQAFLVELAVEAVKTAAAGVITPEVTEAMLARAQEQRAAVRAAVKGVDRELVTEVLRRLTRVHVGVQDAPTFVESIFHGQDEGCSAGDLAERFIDSWRAVAVEIHVDMAWAKRLLKYDPVAGTSYPATELVPRYGDLLGMMCDGLFYELGVWFSMFNLVADDELPADCCRFRLHQRVSPVLWCLSEDQLLVNETPERLAASGIAGRPRANPANGNACTIISRHSEQQLRAEVTTWDQFGYLVLLLADELRSSAPILVSLCEVEDLLAKLNQAFPELVTATLHDYSPLQVAQVLRWLLRDGVSVRDLRRVLELMLDFSYATGVRSPTGGWSGLEPYVYVGDQEFTGEPYFTADDPYVPQFDIDRMQLFAEPTPEWLANGRIQAEFVKCGMRQYLTHKVSAGQNTIVCYLVDSEIEKRLLAFRLVPDKSPFNETELAEILQGLADGFTDQIEHPLLFLATTPDVAFLVQDMIARDFPEVQVLHRQVVDESANVQPIGKVPADKTAP